MIGQIPLNIPNLALVAIGIAYAVSLAKDWRPIRTLRAENRDLREALQLAQGEIDKCRTKIGDLESQIATLKTATDLSVLQSEHKEIAGILGRVVARLDSLDHALRANTETIAAKL